MNSNKNDKHEDELKMLADIKILIVEDFNTVRTLMGRMLNNLGLNNIIEAKDGYEAWDIVQRQYAKGDPIKFILSDINMPVMTGLELLENVRSHPDMANTPFLIISCENEQNAILKAVEFRVDNYIIKPVTVEQLRRKIIQIFFGS